eukprot:Blabericola_migrator_1__432@NODE_1103_length_5428_cov_759_412423_g752_i1_p7_GENE_NODE_1103_length_5428_cov_759_412423_g752_i1NODE_1103_length_5428_cov_759_412423_g752_i1_p7_ORF_typecomplete_len105_score10_92_NODE_1103_length_5428_cov_759_412423_g752_i124272741
MGQSPSRNAFTDPIQLQSTSSPLLSSILDHSTKPPLQSQSFRPLLPYTPALHSITSSLSSPHLYPSPINSPLHSSTRLRLFSPSALTGPTHSIQTLRPMRPHVV